MDNWPQLDFSKYKETVSAVHLWTQIIGKIRLSRMPWINHSWHVSLYVSAKGLTTGPIPYEKGVFEIVFDFNSHVLQIATSQDTSAEVALQSGSVSGFYRQVLEAFNKLDIKVQIHPRPNELEPAIPFHEDTTHRQYDKNEMKRLWQAFISVHKVFQTFRSGFIGKVSPVHLFWGAFDLAVTRFSGRTAPEHPGGMPNIPLKVMQEAYSHEVSSAGFWPGNEQFPQPVFYSYCYPTPPAFAEQKVLPAEAFYSKEMGEFFLPYATISSEADPETKLMNFLQSTYEAAANTGNWNRNALEFNFSEFQSKF